MILKKEWLPAANTFLNSLALILIASGVQRADLYGSFQIFMGIVLEYIKYHFTR